MLKFTSIFAMFLFSLQLTAMQLDISYMSDPKPEFYTTAGVFLPFGVVGVRDKYPMWGFTYSNEAFTAPRYEISLLAANAKSVTYYNGSLSYRIDMEIYESAYAFIKFGIDGHYYKRKPTTLTEYDFVFLGGGHVGMGFMTGVGPGLHLRADLKFNMNPGKTAYVGLGLMYQWDPPPPAAEAEDVPAEEAEQG